MVKFLDLNRLHQSIQAEITEACHRVINSGYYILGPEVEAFEHEFAQYCGAKYCVGVSSGLEALVVSLRSLDIGEGDEVIVPAHTFIATWLAVTHVGAKIIPVDVCKTSYNLDVNLLEKKITQNTKAIIPVHLYGHPAEMSRINSIADAYNLKVIEDNAQAQGATYMGKTTGSLAHLGATSFYPGKNLGALGDGGAITCNSSEIAKRLKQLRNYGSIKKYEHTMIGYNTRLDEIQAAVLRVKLKYLEEWNQNRRQIANRYSALLPKQIITPQVSSDSHSAWHLYVIQSAERDQLADFLSAQGIQTTIHYPTPPHQQACYQLEFEEYQRDFPVTEELSKKIISLPMDPLLSIAEQDLVIESVNRFYKGKQ